jgi:hypothetical protein
MMTGIKWWGLRVGGGMGVIMLKTCSVWKKIKKERVGNAQ